MAAARILLAFVVTLAPAVASPAAEEPAARPPVTVPLVAIVRSKNLAPYRDAAAAFALEVRGRIVELDLGGDEARAEALLAQLGTQRPALMLALGPLAATVARRVLPSVPLVFALVPHHERYDLAAGPVTGVALVRPPRAQLETLKAVAPAIRRVGVLHDPGASRELVELAARAAKDLGLVLVPVALADPTELPARAAELAAKVDALWMVPDRTVATVQAFDVLLGAARARRLPLFALGEEQVRGGALLALAPDVPAMGRQAARLANRILHDGVAPRALPVTDPDGLWLSLNVTALRAMPDGPGLALGILGFAARRGWPVRLYE